MKLPQATGPETITKSPVHSGSTKLPKAVINTHGAPTSSNCPDHARYGHGPPVLVDWLPWNHTFGGNKNMGMTLYHGGTLYIDEGKPTAAGIMRRCAICARYRPRLTSMCPPVLNTLPVLRRTMPCCVAACQALEHVLLSRVAGTARVGQPVPHAGKELGHRVVMGTGLGMTESSPSALFVNRADVRSGDLGVPVPGLELKLPCGGQAGGALPRPQCHARLLACARGYSRGI